MNWLQNKRKTYTKKFLSSLVFSCFNIKLYKGKVTQKESNKLPLPSHWEKHSDSTIQNSLYIA